MESDKNDYTAYYWYLIFLYFYCDQKAQVFVVIGVLSIVLFGVNSVVFKHENTLRTIVLNKIWILVFFLVQFIIIAMIIVYIKELRQTINSSGTGQKKLLEGLHEGVMIVAKKDSEVAFSNRSTKKLIEKFIGVDKSSK